MMKGFNGKERVLVCPLGWGLGHAARVIPIISSLTKKGCEVIIAGDQTSLDLIKTRFPQLQYIHFPSISVKLSSNSNQLFSLIGIAFKLISLTIRENKRIKSIVKDLSIDVIISDNRYGLYVKNIKSIFITHQLRVIFPFPFKWAMPIGQLFIRHYSQKFDECWVPDYEDGVKLSGKLSKSRFNPNNVRFIGPLSRFSELDVVPKDIPWDIVAIMSGPPPHRELLENILVTNANSMNMKTLIIQGLPQYPQKKVDIGNLTLVADLPDDEMAQIIVSANRLICRSGYSAIMDLTCLHKKALLIPTPGQTEQEYLAQYHQGLGTFNTISQKELGIISKTELLNLLD